MAASVWGFFYGGLINPDVMQRLGMRPTSQEVATLPGFELQISPLVNLVPSPGSTAYGLLLKLTHDELQGVYSQLRARYLPQAVLAHGLDGRVLPALCYVVEDMPDGQADADHVLALLRPAEDLGFPVWYLSRIRSFLPDSGTS